MDDVGHPAQLLDSLQHAAGKEYGTLTVVGIVVAGLVLGHLTLGEVVIVVDEVHLNACLDDGRNLDDKRVVCVVDDKIHARKTYHLVQLTAALVDISPFRHEGTYLVTILLNGLRNGFTHQRKGAVRNVGNYLLVNE